MFLAGPTARLLDGLLARFPMQALFSRRQAAGLTVLAYHHTPDRRTFSAHMDFVRRCLRPVSLTEVIESLDGGRRLPAYAALITFDDADPSLLEVAVPVLRERGLPAIAFVVTSLLGTSRSFWWEEVRALLQAGGSIRDWEALDSATIVRRLKTVDTSTRLRLMDELRATARLPLKPRPQLRREDLSILEAAGVTVGSHTATHPCLSQCSAETVIEEVQKAHAVLATALGHEPEAFAYPNGDQDPRVRDIVRRAGYRVAFLFDHRISSWPPEDPLRISRLRVNSTASSERLRLIVSGLHPFIHHALGRP